MLKGKDGVVRYGASKDLIGAVQDWNLDPTAETVEGWGMGDDWKRSFTTVKGHSGSVTFYLDPEDPGAGIAVGDEIDVDFYPGGEATGAAFYSGTFNVTGTPRSAAKDGIPTQTINLLGTGPLIEGIAP